MLMFNACTPLSLGTEVIFLESWAFCQALFLEVPLGTCRSGYFADSLYWRWVDHSANLDVRCAAVLSNRETFDFVNFLIQTRCLLCSAQGILLLLMLAHCLLWEVQLLWVQLLFIIIALLLRVLFAKGDLTVLVLGLHVSLINLLLCLLFNRLWLSCLFINQRCVMIISESRPGFVAGVGVLLPWESPGCLLSLRDLQVAIVIGLVLVLRWMALRWRHVIVARHWHGVTRGTWMADMDGVVRVVGQSILCEILGWPRVNPHLHELVWVEVRGVIHELGVYGVAWRDVLLLTLLGIRVRLGAMHLGSSAIVVDDGNHGMSKLGGINGIRVMSTCLLFCLMLWRHRIWLTLPWLLVALLCCFGGHRVRGILLRILLLATICLFSKGCSMMEPNIS